MNEAVPVTGAQAVPENAVADRTATESAFYRQFRHGTFSGILRWDQLDVLWAKVRAVSDCGWYTYTVFDPHPAEPVDAAGLDAFITEVDTTLRKLQHYDHCGLVYADDREAPTFVMVFHPHRVVGCGGKDTGPALPGWTLSLLPPVDLPAALAPPAKPGLIGRLRAMAGAAGLGRPR